MLIARRTLAAVLLALPSSTAAEETPSPPSPYDAHLRELDRLALDDAYRGQLAKLFTVWMADSHGQPGRAVNGANRARRAYIAVMKEIEAREQAANQP
jgi:hypothetical protein